MTTVKNASRITGLFEACRRDGRRAFIAYLTAGDPSMEATLPLILGLERAGVDLIELGVPFSDPIADGPVIQRASERALAAGATLQKVLDLAKEIRNHSEIPILLFTYLNPVLRYGYEALAKAASEAGIDGVLLTLGTIYVVFFGTSQVVALLFVMTNRPDYLTSIAACLIAAAVSALAAFVRVRSVRRSRRVPVAGVEA